MNEAMGRRESRTSERGELAPPSRDQRAPSRSGHQTEERDAGPVVYDVPEAMQCLRITRPTIYRFLRSGELRSFRLGTRRLVSAEALREFIRARESVESG